MFAATINLTIFIIMIIIYLNEMKNISMFIYKFNYIKDYSKLIMKEKCNNIYCEAETDRYQIAKDSFKLLLPNDIFNSKTYIVMIFIVSIMRQCACFCKRIKQGASMATLPTNFVLLDLSCSRVWLIKPRASPRCVVWNFAQGKSCSYSISCTSVGYRNNN
jgi:hypothetical protein